MAERRMFAKTIIDSDAFLDMPQSTQLLYFQLAMRADDDGFINNPRSILRNIGCKDDDLSILAAKKFIIPFESGVIVIKHWRIHNYIQKDRYHETKYKVEKAKLSFDENGAYTQCIQPVSILDTQVRLELGKDSIEESLPDKKSKYGPESNVLLTDSEYQKLREEYGKTRLDAMLSELSYYKLSSGKKYKSDYGAIRKWVADKVIKSTPKTTELQNVADMPGFSEFERDYDRLCGITPEPEKTP
jgi:hypothetical protein